MSETLIAQPAFRGMIPVTAQSPGVNVRLLEPIMVSVLARRGLTPVLMAKAREFFGLELTDAPKRVRAGDICTLGVGPGRWLFLGTAPGHLAVHFAELASLSDHSDGYAVFEIWGPQTARTLAKGVPLDLGTLMDDDVAVTSIAHIGAIIWKSAPDRFAIAVFRSFAASFWHWLAASAAEFGLGVEEDAP